ncbi:MAG TPA: peptidylprolyl isomerase [Flavobacteriales bacterium]|nr:peptidylprolyl isomerase [Flavobacteriales bacterium]
MKITLFNTLALSVFFLASCGGDSKFPGFDKSESGLYYTITSLDEHGRQVALDHVVTIEMTYGTDDSVLFDSKKMEFPTQLKVSAPIYDGDVMEGFAMMKVGDEAVFKTSADSFFKRIANIALPSFIDSGSYLTFTIKMLNTQTIEELQAARDAEAEANKSLEAELIQSYLNENNITVEPRESGLYFVETAPGSGVPVERGSTVKVHYIGRLLTGEKFDASFDHNPPDPIEFALGTGRVIPGWDEGIGYMTVGSKATLIIPSHLAYGDRPPPGAIIKAYSPLVFDVELVDAK